MATAATPATGIPATGTRGRFVWHELMTPDPEAAKTFYGKVIGWKTIPMEGAPMQYTLWLTGDAPDTTIGGMMELTKEAADMGAPPNWLAYIEVPDADAAVEQTVKAGGKVIVPAKFVEQAGRFAILQDPQGVVFAVITSAQPLAPESDPAVREFSWHELTTTDLPAAIDFYQQLFGWEKKSEFDMGPMGVYYMYGRDRFTYGGMMNKPAEAPGVYWLHYARVESADAAAERAQEAGGKVILGPMEVPGGDRIAVIIDPQGATFAVHSKSQA